MALMRRLSHSDIIAMFSRVGQIKLFTEDNIVDWGGSEPHPINWLIADARVKEDRPCVYLWVEEAPDQTMTVLYIGKAGTTLSRRCREHSQGFRGAGRGRAHAEALIPKIKAGSQIGIYAHWPKPVRFAGELIPSHSSVEDWLISAIQPKPVRNR